MNKQVQTDGKLMVIGIDAHADQFCAAAVYGTNAVDCEHQWTHSTVPISRWRRWLQKNVEAGTVLVCEAGSNSFELARVANEHNISMIVLESQRVGQLSKTYCKTDKLDAIKLARVYFSGLGSSVWQPDSETVQKRELLKLYLQSVNDSTRAINRFRSYLSTHNVRLGKVKITSPAAFSLASGSYNWTPVQREFLELLFEKIDYTQKMKTRLYEMIAGVVLSNPLILQLIRLCGISIVNAFSITATIGDINRFETHKKLAAYLGLCPSLRQSGNRSRSGGVARRGRSCAKSYLIQAAQSILRSRNASGKKLRMWGLALRFRKGKHISVVAVARKLSVAIWYLLNDLMPTAQYIELDLRKKLKKIAEQLKLDYIKRLGYESVRQFIDEKILILNGCA